MAVQVADLNNKMNLERSVKMKILILSSAYNGLTQRVHTELLQRGHIVSIELAINEQTMVTGVQLFNPDIIICPFLKHRVPDSIWLYYVCIIVHPGTKGDRGAFFLGLGDSKPGKRMGRYRICKPLPRWMPAISGQLQPLKCVRARKAVFIH